eukprot:TRINITY_DN33411_c0_g2_i1.p1 TRINITY_DN33411_c0_g2~~TRINITY_DN33411_c0_g2_i1.p1  ORF type:complete len:264 (-),score=23.94 TRINITY_DN33411_c0_g2_i1:54-845(-)
MGARPSGETGSNASSPTHASRVGQRTMVESLSAAVEGSPGEASSSSGPARWAWSDVSSRSVALNSPSRGGRERRHRSNAQVRGQALMPGNSPSSSSTATPPTLSGNSSSCGGTWRESPDAPDSCSEVASECSESGGNYVEREAQRQLSEARHKSNESMEALRLNLQGFGGAVAVRYASWPVGCPVEVSIPPDDTNAGSGWSTMMARLVCYDANSNSIQVRLRDGSCREVPAFRVRRPGPRPKGHGHADITGARSRTRSPELLR